MATFFFDRTVSAEVGESLRAAGMSVVMHNAYYLGVGEDPESIPDVKWIPEVCGKDWVIVTNDKRLRRNREEVEALRVNGARVFTFTSGNLTIDEMIATCVQLRERMEEIASNVPKPFLAGLDPSGRVFCIPKVGFTQF